MTAILWPNLATLGRCSPIFRPGAEVWISLYGPPLAWPTLRSNRSMVLGPPFIQSRITAFLRCGCLAASAANVSIHPETEQAATPAADSFSHSRRDRRGVSVVRAIVGISSEVCPLSVVRCGDALLQGRPPVCSLQRTTDHGQRTIGVNDSE